MQSSTAAAVALSPEARADLFCQNLGPDLLGKRQSKWKSLALFIETKLPQFDKQKIYHLDRSETGEFRSITYNAQNESIYIDLRKKDFPASSRHMFRSSGWRQDSEDESRVKMTYSHPVLLYDPNAPKLMINYTVESRPKSKEEKFMEQLLSFESRLPTRLPTIDDNRLKMRNQVESAPKPEDRQFETPPDESKMEEVD